MRHRHLHTCTASAFGSAAMAPGGSAAASTLAATSAAPSTSAQSRGADYSERRRGVGSFTHASHHISVTWPPGAILARHVSARRSGASIPNAPGPGSPFFKEPPNTSFFENRRTTQQPLTPHLDQPVRDEPRVGGAPAPPRGGECERARGAPERGERPGLENWRGGGASVIAPYGSRPCTTRTDVTAESSTRSQRARAPAAAARRAAARPPRRRAATSRATGPPPRARAHVAGYS